MIGAVASVTNSLAKIMTLEEAANRGQALFDGAMAGSGKADLEQLIAELTARIKAVDSGSR